MELNLTVLNVKCGGCASIIENGLQNITGIETINVNIESGSVNISGNALNHDEISEKLTELGYPEN